MSSLCRGMKRRLTIGRRSSTAELVIPTSHDGARPGAHSLVRLYHLKRRGELIITTPTY